MTLDTWISRLSLFCWSTFVSSEAIAQEHVCDLMSEDGRSWLVQEVNYLFGGPLADRILATSISIHL